MSATIKKGSQGSDVTKWQGLLTSAGFPVDATGVFDDATDAQTRAWQTAHGLTSDGIVGPASWLAMTGEAEACKPDSHAKFGRDTLVSVWPRILDEASKSEHPEIQALAAAGGPNLAALQIAGAQAKLESNYGLAQYTNKETGEKSGVINNWGAVQGQPGFLASDTHADGSAYTAHYRIYDTPEDGAFDMLRQMTIRRPNSWARMNEGDIDAWAHAMRTKDPITGIPLYFEQSEEGRAHGIQLNIVGIACALTEPIAAVRGGPAPPGGVASSDSGGGGWAGKVFGALGALAAIGLGTWWAYFRKGRFALMP